MKLEAFIVDNIPLIKEGDNLAEIICNNTKLEDGDIVVIASTIVAKSEGQIFRLKDITPTDKAVEIANKNRFSPAFVQAVLERSRDCLVDSPIMLVETYNGNVCINAGLDDSNIENGFILDLPKNPDVSAEYIGLHLQNLTSKKIGVVITDTNGRAFKTGQTGVAVGLYHIPAIKNWRGKNDLYGHALDITEEAIADEIAGTANLLMGEGDGGTPVVIIRGLDVLTGKKVSVKNMYRPDDKDIIKKGLRSLNQSNL
ncbi:MAG: coenzyme F420-0:L-glutamate ligase [Methanohalobium sp.]|uniref:coenzyme F420-0:L-glutamate ligase n=1 Tax=Methanohalobium sp. TaxID=2837493 RepID=UPI00397E7E9B